MLRFKPYLPYAIVLVVGLLVMGGAWMYYGFGWGTEPCTGAPTDAANCGDADMGGIGLFIIGLPIAFVGVAGLAVRALYGIFRSKK